MIRTLRPDEAIPHVEARRYLNQAGYVRLRWRIGTELYVEDYEHRVVMGRPVGMEVHHLDGNKSNNDPSNLVVLDPATHTRMHQDEYRAAGKFKGSRVSRERAVRKAERDARWASIISRYQAGFSTLEIGREIGLDPSNVYRGLVRRGVTMRAKGWIGVRETADAKVRA